MEVVLAYGEQQYLSQKWMNTIEIPTPATSPSMSSLLDRSKLFYIIIWQLTPFFVATPRGACLSLPQYMSFIIRLDHAGRALWVMQINVFINTGFGNSPTFETDMSITPKVICGWYKKKINALRFIVNDTDGSEWMSRTSCLQDRLKSLVRDRF